LPRRIKPQTQQWCISGACALASALRWSDFFFSGDEFSSETILGHS